MGKPRRIARRAFLIGSAAIAGGVAFGVYAVRKPHPNPLAAGLGPDEATFNPWVKISPEGITLIAPHTDLGQGARSIQAALIAEELDLEFGQFDVEPGVPAAAYYNTATASGEMPFRQRDDGFVAETARSVASAVFKLAGAQVTGGSTTVADSYVKLRQAGAVARETLKAAAARRFSLAVSDLSTEAGEVVLPDGRRVPYTELAADAADIEPVNAPPLRPASEWRLLGQEMQRLDIVAKSTGTQVYGIDLSLDGMVHASLRTNPRQGGALESFDASSAESMPGVRQVLALSDGVAVVADNSWNAIQAVNAIEVDWDPAPYPADMPAHWEALAAAFTDDYLDREWRSEGNVDDPAFADGPSAEYRAPYLAHAPLEPLSALIRVSDDNRVDLWVAHQLPRFAQQIVADIVGVDADDVRLHNQYAGGSFGHRLEFDNVRYAAEIAVQIKGTPVKLTYSREEDFAQDYVRQISLARWRGFAGDGRIESLDIEVASPSVLASQAGRIGLPAAGPDTQIPAGIWDAPYAIPNLRVRTYAVPDLAPVSSWRSVGASTGGFMLETAVDELLHAAGADPLEGRLAMCDSDIARGVLTAVLDMSGWGSPLAPRRGRGVALVFSFGVYAAEVVEVTDTGSGIRIDKVFVAADVGKVLDPVNFESQVAGGVVWGLGHAMNCETTYADGMAEQTNYHRFEGMRLSQCPQIEVRGLENSREVLGIGEPPVPPAAPALANAIFAAAGKRLREMPFDKFVDFV